MNLDAIDLKRALVGTLGILLAVVFIGILGPAGLLAGLCAIFLGALDEPDPVRERLALRTRFVLIGALVGGRWAGDDIDEPEGAGADVQLPDEPLATGHDSHAIGEVTQSEIGVFALVRALAVAIATASGYELFQDHPVWAVLTVVLVLQMPARQTWKTGLQRTAGTILGVLIGILVVQCLDSSTTAIVIAFVLAGFGLMAFKPGRSVADDPRAERPVQSSSLTLRREAWPSDLRTRRR